MAISCISAAMKKLPKASVPAGNGWPPAKRDPLESRSALAACGKGESPDSDQPANSPDDAKCEGRPQAGPILDHLEHCLLLRDRQVSCAPHREPGADSGESVVGT